MANGLRRPRNMTQVEWAARQAGLSVEEWFERMLGKHRTLKGVAEDTGFSEWSLYRTLHKLNLSTDRQTQLHK